MVLVISLDGNIGAGKSTLLEAIRTSMADVEVVTEPVGEWTKLKNEDGRSLLELFYEDKRRWAYTFQGCAFLTRVKALRSVLATTQARVVITERSVLTDRYVFAEMLRESGDMDSLEWELYARWFDMFAADAPMGGVIYLTTGVATSAARIGVRGRTGEGAIPAAYLTALEAQHEKWLAGSTLPVLRLSTEEGVSVDSNLAAIRAFVAELDQPELMGPRGSQTEEVL
jgi:deoxyadenosine/deoxycytidine kinase